VHPPAGWLLAMLHAGGPAQPPFWLVVPLLLAALIGLTRTTHVVAARIGLLLLTVGLALAVAETRTTGVTGGAPASRYWPGLALLVAGTGVLLAATVAAVAARPALASRSFGWRQPAAAALVVVSLGATVVLAGAWLVRGTAGPLSGSNPVVVPLFAQAELATPAAPRAVVVAGTPQSIRYTLVRRPTGGWLGDADVRPDAHAGTATRRASTALASAVRELAGGSATAGPSLASLGVGYVVAPGGASMKLAAAIGRTGEFTLLPTQGANVWRTAAPAGQLTVLAPVDATAARAGRVERTAGVQLLSSTADGSDAQVPAGPAGRLAVLADPDDGRWQASIDGHRLPSTTAYGWAAAFPLPAAGGRLHIDHATTGHRSLWLVIELVAVALAVLLSLPPRRRTEPVVV
jgi:hypothetical protein